MGIHKGQFNWKVANVHVVDDISWPRSETMGYNIMVV
jgi:hypothetical protein